MNILRRILAWCVGLYLVVALIDLVLLVANGHPFVTALTEALALPVNVIGQIGAFVPMYKATT